MRSRSMTVASTARSTSVSSVTREKKRRAATPKESTAASLLLTLASSPQQTVDKTDTFASSSPPPPPLPVEHYPTEVIKAVISRFEPGYEDIFLALVCRTFRDAVRSRGGGQLRSSMRALVKSSSRLRWGLLHVAIAQRIISPTGERRQPRFRHTFVELVRAHGELSVLDELGMLKDDATNLLQLAVNGRVDAIEHLAGLGESDMRRHLSRFVVAVLDGARSRDGFVHFRSLHNSAQWILKTILLPSGSVGRIGPVEWIVDLTLQCAKDLSKDPKRTTPIDLERVLWCILYDPAIGFGGAVLERACTASNRVASQKNGPNALHPIDPNDPTSTATMVSMLNHPHPVIPLHHVNFATRLHHYLFATSHRVALSLLCWMVERALPMSADIGDRVAYLAKEYHGCSNLSEMITAAEVQSAIPPGLNHTLIVTAMLRPKTSASLIWIDRAIAKSGWAHSAFQNDTLGSLKRGQSLEVFDIVRATSLLTYSTDAQRSTLHTIPSVSAFALDTLCKHSGARTALQSSFDIYEPSTVYTFWTSVLERLESIINLTHITEGSQITFSHETIEWTRRCSKETANVDLNSMINVVHVIATHQSGSSPHPPFQSIRLIWSIVAEATFAAAVQQGHPSQIVAVASTMRELLSELPLKRKRALGAIANSRKYKNVPLLETKGVASALKAVGIERSQRNNEVVT